ncbi:MAG: Hint domain-containing protein [Pseudomonadota bacterium]
MTPPAPPPTDRTAQDLPVYLADEVTVTNGVNFEDPMSFADELVLDDIYEVNKHATTRTLRVTAEGDALTIAKGGDMGTPGALIAVDSAVTLMSPDGATLEALVMVEVEDGDAVEVYVLPLAHMPPRTQYRLVGVDTDNPRRRFAEAACVAFTRGTHITLASGEQRKIEDLEVGDRVLTRDDGPQEVRWIGQNTRRAVGDFAPVLIRRGTLNNENDLIVSPDHRLFIYQRDDAIGAGRSEVLVKVRHLINDDTVVRLEGGFVDYFQLLFDSHQIIYAEGIAAESLLVDPRTRPALPEEVEADMSAHIDRHHNAFEIEGTLLDGDAVEKLRKASAR